MCVSVFAQKSYVCVCVSIFFLVRLSPHFLKGYVAGLTVHIRNITATLRFYIAMRNSLVSYLTGFLHVLLL